MRTREDELNRLRVASPCRSPWEEMSGNGRRRHCLECDREVFDFAQLTAREVAGLLEATGGGICARLTSDGAGRLVTLPSPRAAALAAPAAPRRSPLVAAAVAAALGLSGVAWTASAVEPPAAAEGAEREPAESPRQAAGEAGGTLAGTLRRDGGEPVPAAEIRVVNGLDRKERTARTDEEGRFSVAPLPAGIYRLEASWRGHDLAREDEILLRAGETGGVGLTVRPEVWQQIAEGSPEPVSLGGAIAVVEPPVRELYAGAALAVSGVAGKSIVTRREEYTWEVETDLVLTEVFKGETRERVISVFHDQSPDEGPAGGLQPGAKVLAFLDPRELEDGRPAGGYALHSYFGLKTPPAADLAAYAKRLEELARISRRGAPRPVDVVEWLVATAEEPATRWEAVRELSAAVRQLDDRAERSGTPADGYAQKLQGVVADFAAAGGRVENDDNPAIFASLLTAAQRERLTAALLRTARLGSVDLDLFELVERWRDDRALPWLIDRLQKGDVRGQESWRAVKLVAEAMDDSRLTELVAAGERELDALDRQAMTDDSEETAGESLFDKREAAADQLRLRFLEAMAQRGRGARVPL